MELIEILSKTDELSVHENSNHILMANGGNEKTPLLTDVANRQPSVEVQEKGWSFSDGFIPNVLLIFFIYFAFI